jgi:glycosyltransferase involved in cell wall biosynthesis
MSINSISNFPSPPLNKTGWPWTESSDPLPERMPDGTPWPKISIVTPSYNQAQYLEETIRSVLLQNYPNLEYIIIDGGSTDGSVEIIKKYEPWLAYWESQKDQGQSHAINKGIQQATGEFFAWINSDDYYLPGIFPERVTMLTNSIDIVLVYGDIHFIDKNGHFSHAWETKQTSPKKMLLEGNHIPQPSTLMRLIKVKSIQGVDMELKYVMDYALWLKLSLYGEFKYLPGFVANFRIHPDSKETTSSYDFVLEKLNWLKNWSDIQQILSEEEQMEMFRRHHIVAAVYAILHNNVEYATSHLNIAFSTKLWPYGNVDMLAKKIFYFDGIGKRTMRDTWERYEDVHQALFQTDHVSMARKLHRRLAAKYHFWAITNMHQGNITKAIMSFIKGMYYDPRYIYKKHFIRNAIVSFARLLFHRNNSAHPANN